MVRAHADTHTRTHTNRRYFGKEKKVFSHFLHVDEEELE